MNGGGQEGAASAERVVQRLPDPLEHRLDVLVHGLVREAEDTIAPLLVEPASSLRVVLGLITMTVAVDLDDEWPRRRRSRR